MSSESISLRYFQPSLFLLAYEMRKFKRKKIFKVIYP